MPGIASAIARASRAMSFRFEAGTSSRHFTSTTCTTAVTRSSFLASGGMPSTLPGHRDGRPFGGADVVVAGEEVARVVGALHLTEPLEGGRREDAVGDVVADEVREVAVHAEGVLVERGPPSAQSLDRRLVRVAGQEAGEDQEHLGVAMGE